MRSHPTSIAVAFTGDTVEAVGLPAVRGASAPEWRREVACAWRGEGEPPPANVFTSLFPRRRGERIAVGLPSSGSLLRVLCLPPADPDEIRGIVSLRMSRQMPFPDDEMVVAHEELRRDAEGVWVAAAAVPLKMLEALDAAARAAGLRIARFDLNSLALWRLLRMLPELPATALVCIQRAGRIEILVLDGGVPVLSRMLGPEEDEALWMPELTRSLAFLEIELARPVPDTLLMIGNGNTRPDRSIQDRVASMLGPDTRIVTPELPGPVALGVALRSIEPGTLSLVPQQWEIRERTRLARRKQNLAAALAVGVWAVATAVLAAGPYVYRRQEDRLRRQLDRLDPAYQTVRDLRTRVRIIAQYTDQSQELLEFLREVSLRLPANVNLNSWQYRRDEDLRIVGDAARTDDVYLFKTRLDDVPRFRSSVLTGPTLDSRTQRQAFEIEISLRRESEL